MPKGLNERHHDYNDNSQLTSRFSLQSELPSIDTVQVFDAQLKFNAQDVNRTELLDCEEEFVQGLKTATQASLIRHYEEEFRQKDLVKEKLKQEEKKLDYSASLKSKFSQPGKQGSQCSRQPDTKNYASNPSNHIFIADSEDFSVHSDIKQRH